jgi:mono/diheme cytochrome c family protein
LLPSLDDSLRSSHRASHAGIIPSRRHGALNQLASFPLESRGQTHAASSIKVEGVREEKEQEMRLTGVEYESAMYGRTMALLLATVLVGFAGGIAIRARGADQAPAADQPLSEQERGRHFVKGKELFLARCARCHDERGDKPLKTGPPLNERGLSSEQISRAVNGRLRDKPEEERRAVTLYISSLMKTKGSEEKAPPKSYSLDILTSPVPASRAAPFRPCRVRNFPAEGNR